ncbi:MAG: hypothetical protein KDD33_06090 [Bdellovibrionales bacterium]|nr:hypothetical protein [Bdellovibrionales bacterium]
MKLKAALFLLIFCIPTMLFAGPWSRAFTEVTGPQANENVIKVGGCNSWNCASSCKKIYPTVKKLLGSKADCMMKLFFKETTCRSGTREAARKKNGGNNPNAGFGLCTIEASAALRAKRGPNCRKASTSNVSAQILCCRDLMKSTTKSKSYFGPVRRGQVPKCF